MTWAILWVGWIPTSSFLMNLKCIRAVLSYFIGCVFGRYSLDQDGLVYAGGDWDDSKYTTFKPNKENIILLTDRQYFDDDRDIIVRLKEFVIEIKCRCDIWS